jgi:hypothetical protein
MILKLLNGSLKPVVVLIKFIISNIIYFHEFNHVLNIFKSPTSDRIEFTCKNNWGNFDQVAPIKTENKTDSIICPGQALHWLLS